MPPGHDIYDLAMTLLSAQTASDVVTQAPPLIACVLGPSHAYRIELLPTPSGRQGDQIPEADRVCIPLVSPESSASPFGAIFVSDLEDGECVDLVLDDEAVVAVARLVATAIVTKQRIEAEHSRTIKEAAELKFDVVSMLSHEMRTPLASIKGYATALLLDDVDWDAASRAEFLQTIEAEADHLTKLVADILESAAIEAGALRIDLEPVLVPRIAKRVIDKVGIQSARHRFVLMFAPDFPVVEADTQRIEQVLTNLVDNAVKYAPDGGLVVLRGEVRSNEVIISVVDQGVGIAPEHLNKLFERFFRASSDTRRRIVGTGLGLPIADAIVRALGGRIWAESTVGSGTTLSFSLPHPRPSILAVERE